MDLLSIYQESVSGNITELYCPCELLKSYNIHFMRIRTHLPILNWLKQAQKRMILKKI